MPYKDAVKQREFRRLWVAKRRREFFIDKKCIDCGTNQNLELDHDDPTLKISHKVWSWTQAKRLREIAKCSIRCRVCHIEKHAALKRKPCGTRTSYERGCRCRPCKNANNLRRANQRAKKLVAAERFQLSSSL